MPKKLNKEQEGPRCNACIHGQWEAPYWYCRLLKERAHWSMANDPNLSCYHFRQLCSPRPKSKSRKKLPVFPVLQKNGDAQSADHYRKFSIQSIDFILDHKLDYFEGNVLKYLDRYKYKGTPVKDLKKMRQYVDWLIEREERRLNGCSGT